MKKIIEQSIEHIGELGYAAYAKPTVNKSLGFYGYYFLRSHNISGGAYRKKLPEELQFVICGTLFL